MKKGMRVLCVGIALGAAAGAFCLTRKKEEKKGVRHAAAKMVDAVNDLIDSVAKR